MKQRTKLKESEATDMKETVYESEVFAIGARGVLPFQIIIETSSENGVKTVEVIRKEFYPLENGKSVAKEMPLTCSIWKEA